MRHYSLILKTLMFLVLLYLFGMTNSYGEEKFDPIDSQSSIQTTAGLSLKPEDRFDIFAPKTHTLDTRFDYTVWDKALMNRVLPLGPSLRRFASRAKPRLGSRFIKRSQSSKYRLEGSRVMFFSFSDGYIDVLTEYKKDLVRLANEHDIQSFSRHEQLAFWLNLHNVVLIETIAKEHPTKNPSALVFGAEPKPLHEAELITIRNVPLSLRNIRENIVYENWDNPNVIYGFFRGDIGGPRLTPFAFTANNVDHVLESHGFEYITSLRGFHTTPVKRKVSTIYEAARPYYFQNWPTDLEDHFEGYLQDHELLSEVQQNKPLSFIKYDTIIADLWGGDKSISVSPVFDSRSPEGRPPILFELAIKVDELKRKGLLNQKSEIIIEDIETEDNSTLSTP